MIRYTICLLLVTGLLVVGSSTYAMNAIIQEDQQELPVITDEQRNANSQELIDLLENQNAHEILEDKIHALLDAGVNPTYQNCRILKLACEKDLFFILEALIHSDIFKEYPAESEELLTLSLKNSNYTNIKLLVDNGLEYSEDFLYQILDRNVTNPGYILLLAVRKNYYKLSKHILQKYKLEQKFLDEALILLASYDADPNTLCASDLDTLNLLLEKGASLNGPVINDPADSFVFDVPINHAIAHQNYPVILALLKAGASNDSLPRGVFWALGRVTKETEEVSIDECPFFNLVKFLIYNGASVDQMVDVTNPQDVEQAFLTPLEHALRSCTEKVALRIFKYVKDIEIHTNALIDATYSNYTNFIKALFDRYPNYSSNMEIALQVALESKNQELIDLLAEHAQVTDWNKVYADILENNEMELVPLALKKEFKNCLPELHSQITQRIVKNGDISLLAQVMALNPNISNLHHIFQINSRKSAKPRSPQKPLARRLNFDTKPDTYMPVLIKILNDPKLLEYLSNKRAFVTRIFAKCDIEQVRMVIFWSILYGDLNILDAVLFELNQDDTSLKTKVFGDKAKNFLMLYFALTPVHQDPNIKLNIISRLVRTGIKVTAEIVKRAYDTHDESLAAGLMIYAATSGQNKEGILDLIYQPQLEHSEILNT